MISVFQADAFLSYIIIECKHFFYVYREKSAHEVPKIVVGNVLL